MNHDTCWLLLTQVSGVGESWYMLTVSGAECHSRAAAAGATVQLFQSGARKTQVSHFPADVWQQGWWTGQHTADQDGLHGTVCQLYISSRLCCYLDAGMHGKLTSGKKRGIKEVQGEIRRESQTEKETCRGVKYAVKEFVWGIGILLISYDHLWSVSSQNER